MDKWLVSTGLGTDPIDDVSGVVPREEVPNMKELSESSLTLDDDEPYMLGALYASTLVVDKSSSGAEMALR